MRPVNVAIGAGLVLALVASAALLGLAVRNIYVHQTPSEERAFAERAAAIPMGAVKADVEGVLGPPMRAWSASGFACASTYPCAGHAGGPVLLYVRGVWPGTTDAWYFYFDGAEKLARTEASGN